MQSTAPGQSTSRDSASPTRTWLQWVHPVERCVEVSGELVLGREGDPPMEGRELSRRHARLRFDGPLLLIEDLGSRNGIFVDGLRVAEAPLGPGSVLRLGEWVGVVERASRPPRALVEIAPGLLGGERLQGVTDELHRAARSALPVVLEGETGTGKDVVAAAVHRWSGRSGPLVTVHCASLHQPLCEAELFGYRRGAFPGAAEDSAGEIASADGGTLVLDELLELPADVQAKLLRVVEQQEVTPLGTTRAQRVDVRVVSTCQRSLASAVEAGRVRPDLAARLAGVTVQLPPLRERTQDVVGIFEAALSDVCGQHGPRPSAPFLESLLLYRWPMNVRELVTLSRRIGVVHADAGVLTRRHLPDALREQVQAQLSQAAERAEEPAPRQLLRALQHHGGNLAAAARAMGLSRQKAYRIIEANPELSWPDRSHRAREVPGKTASREAGA